MTDPPASGGMMVSYSPVAMAQRAARLRSLLFRQWLGVVISAVISVVWWLIFKPEPDSLLFWLLIAAVAWSLGRVLTTIVKLRRARKTTARVPLGPAFQIDNQGLVLSTVPEGERVDWSQVSRIQGRNKVFNPGPRLEFAWGPDRAWSVPIIVLDAPPGVIDSALRAFSLGRFGLDLSKVDEIW
ncbi:MAG: hypothetical protein WBL05_12000 [Brooklawnia sp.]|uniref:hypothetical protein n=1 Tax=Brooklawnia sp. TaxID=2699740 RepID=UPI003C78CCC4